MAALVGPAVVGGARGRGYQKTTSRAWASGARAPAARYREEKLEEFLRTAPMLE